MEKSARLLLLALACGGAITGIAAQLSRVVQTTSGTGDTSFNGDGLPGTSTNLNHPYSLAIDNANAYLYIGELYGSRIRKQSLSSGIVTTFAGTGEALLSPDGVAATSSQIMVPFGLVLDAPNTFLYFSDYNRVRKIDLSTNIISTISGPFTAQTGYAGDGLVATAPKVRSSLIAGLDLDREGNVYFCESSNNVVRKVTAATSIISTFCGDGTSGFSGDGGAASSARLNSPVSIAVGLEHIYISDQLNQVIRRVTSSSGIIETFVGVTGQFGWGSISGVPATSFALYHPAEMKLNSDESIMYLAGGDAARVYMVDISTSIVTSVAGTGGRGEFDADGLSATSTAIDVVSGIALDTSRDAIYFTCDTYRVRSAAVAPSGVPSAAPTGPSTAPSAAPSSETYYPAILSTIAGSGSTSYSGEGVSATSAALSSPWGIAIYGTTMFVAGFNANRIYQVNMLTGATTTLAGTGAAQLGQSGVAATSSAILYPKGLAIDSAGSSLYITDYCRIRKISLSTNFISTVAGQMSVTAGSSGNGGKATSAYLNVPHGVAVDVSSNIYIADTFNHMVRKVDATTQIINTIAGQGSVTGFSGDEGPATSATLSSPTAVSVDARTGDVYITDLDNRRIRKITVSTGIMSTVVGSSTYGYHGDGGPATSAGLFYPQQVLLDNVNAPHYYMYIADQGSYAIRRVSRLTGVISTLAGAGVYGFGGDGGAATVFGVAMDPISLFLNGQSLYFSDAGNNRVRLVTMLTPTSSPTTTPTAPSFAPTARPTSPAQTYVVTATAGSGATSYAGEAIPATSQGLNAPFGLAVDNKNNVLYIADKMNSRILKLTFADGRVRTAVGTGSIGINPESPALKNSDVQITYPLGLAMSTAGAALYFNDAYRVRKLAIATGLVTTVAGTVTSTPGSSGDGGKATSAMLGFASDVCLDTSDNVYIADGDNYKIRKVTASTSIISTVVGAGVKGWNGDQAPLSAWLNAPTGLCADANNAGVLYFTEAGTHIVRRYSESSGTLTTVAGIANAPGFNGDNIQATSAGLSSPVKVVIDSSSTYLFITDFNNNRVRRVDLFAGIISTVAGTGGYARSGDGSIATEAHFFSPVYVAVDSSGNLYVDDSQGYVRKLSIASTMSPTTQPSPSALFVNNNNDFVVTTVAGNGSSVDPTGPVDDAAMASTGRPRHLAFDIGANAHNLYVCDDLNNRLRYLSLRSSGSFSSAVVAGDGSAAEGVDGEVATSTGLLSPQASAVAVNGDVYILANHRVIKMDIVTRIVTTFAGGLDSTYVDDASESGVPATSAHLDTPLGLAFDPSAPAVLYIADTRHNLLRRVEAGVISTVCGVYGSAGTFGNDGPALSALMYLPQGLAFLGKQLWITDTYTFTIRMIDTSTGIITKQCGVDFVYGYNGDGIAAEEATQYFVSNVAFSPGGDFLYFSDSYNNRARRVTLASQIITTVAGNGLEGFSGDGGAATSAMFHYADGVAVDSDGNLFVIDVGNFRIRKLTLMAPSVAPTQAPTHAPTHLPTTSPTPTPSAAPSAGPTAAPSIAPTAAPTAAPSPPPSSTPTTAPTPMPSTVPTPTPGSPTAVPSTASPSVPPSRAPSPFPTVTPTSRPTETPTSAPSGQPSRQPLSKPSSQPSSKPSGQPSSQPSRQPSRQPTGLPTLSPSASPSSVPTAAPSSRPSTEPSSEPSGQPSSSPTVAPSRHDPLLVDPLKTEWSRGYARTKFKAYLTYYVLFFFVLLLLLFAVDKSNLFQARVERLLDNARSSGVYLRQVRLAASAGGQDEEASEVAPASRNSDKETSVVPSDPALPAADLKKEGSEKEGAGQVEQTGIAAMHGLAVGSTTVDAKFFKYKDKDQKNTKEFLAYLLSGRCLLGCSDVYFDGGLRLFPGCRLAPGAAEDFLLFLCNNHFVLSCCFSAKGSRYSRNFRRLSLISQHALSFFFQNMIIVICTSAGIGSTYSQATSDPGRNVLLNLVVDIVLCAPLSLFIAVTIKWIYLFQMPVDKAKHRRLLYAVTKNIGIILSVALTMVVICSLIVLSLMTAGAGVSTNISQYVLQVLMVAVVLDVVCSALLFESRYYYGLYLFNYRVNIVTIGQLYLERLLLTSAKRDVDYVEISTQLLFGTVSIDRVLSMQEMARINEASLRRRLLCHRVYEALTCSCLRARTPAAARASAQLEMGAIFDGRGAINSLTDNPMHARRSSGGFLYEQAFVQGRASSLSPVAYTQNPLVTRALEEAARPSNFQFSRVFGGSDSGAQQGVEQYVVNPLADRANVTRSTAAAARRGRDSRALPASAHQTPCDDLESEYRKASVSPSEAALAGSAWEDISGAGEIPEPFLPPREVQEAQPLGLGAARAPGAALAPPSLQRRQGGLGNAAAPAAAAPPRLRAGKRRASFFDKLLFFEQRIAEVEATAQARPGLGSGSGSVAPPPG